MVRNFEHRLSYVYSAYKSNGITIVYNEIYVKVYNSTQRVSKSDQSPSLGLYPELS
jgi:hypothetical protein